MDVWYSNSTSSEIGSFVGIHDRDGNWLLASCLRPLLFISSGETLFLCLDWIDPALVLGRETLVGGFLSLSESKECL